MNEQEIIQSCIRKDTKAQKFLYEKYSAMLLGVCLRYSRSRRDAEDILQEGFLKIFINIRSYSGRGSFEGWMKRIIINSSITYYHQNLKYKHHSDITEINESEILEKELETSEFSQEELLNVINQLSDGYRMVFNMFAIEGYKHKEIAAMLKIDINTSKSQFSRARKIIQQKLLELKKIKYVREQ